MVEVSPETIERIYKDMSEGYRPDIKTCPFCGAGASVFVNRSDKKRLYFIEVKCGYCSATGRTVFTSVKDDQTAILRAIESWNKRV